MDRNKTAPLANIEQIKKRLEPSHEPSVWVGKAPRILYVDDHSTTREIMVYIFESSGADILLAEDGLEGVEMARRWQPDIILMDLRMPRLNGFEAISKIRADEATAHIPIIVTSAWANAKHKKRSSAAGANEHFSKPVDFNHLVKTINRYVKRNS
ncbi:response regulator [Anaerolineales bacterium HSG6]|nr:response regulator [Anaerolineales bacterium HSG6]MDM8530129.1 response regulator [Anaerolineales bacterium HSG25]